ncbi:MAG: choice-of-anchor Q domain-containing protein [Gammaproteobacteria bacterium]
MTHALQIGSPAIDSGDNASVGSLLTDQRGSIFDRIADGDLNSSAIIDIGAFELTLIDYGDAPDLLPAMVR